MSVATYSNLESKGGPRLNEVVAAVSEKMGIDGMVFSLSRDQFSDQIDELAVNPVDAEIIRKSNDRKGNISQLVNRMTMYFADEIYAGRLKKGDQLDSDRELARKMNVGRSAVREALKVLDVLGMIDIRPGQGTYITKREANFFIIPLSWSLFLNGGQIDSILEVRDMLEVKAAELTAKSQDEQGLARLTEIYNRGYQSYIAKDNTAFLEADMDFHICIAECSGNQVIYSMIQTIRNLLKRVSETGMVDEEQMGQIYDEHKGIYAAIITKKPEEAGQAMRVHMENSLKRYNYR